MPSTTTQQPVIELEAFCPICPAPVEVTALLTKLGFHLEFQMEEQRDHASQLPLLPAQYHYQAATHGAKVIYLCGRDTPLDGQPFPPHASRFWLYPGANPEANQHAATTLALAYRLTWLHAPRPEAQEEVA